MNKYISALFSYPAQKIQDELKNSWFTMKAILRANGNEDKFLKLINQKFKTGFSSLDQIDKKFVRYIKESEYDNELNEGLKDFWKYFKKNILGKFNIEQSFIDKIGELLETGNITFNDLEFDRKKVAQNVERQLIKDVKKLNTKAIAIYGIMWLILTIGNFFENYVEQKRDIGKEPGKFMSAMNSFFSKLSWLHPATHYRKYKVTFRRGSDKEDGDFDIYAIFDESLKVNKTINKYLK